MRAGIIFALVSLSIALAGESGPRREGPWWVETIAGSAPVPPAGRLRVASRGRVTVTGTEQDAVYYELKVRVKASSEVEARRLLRTFAVRPLRQSQSVFLAVQHGLGEAEMRVQCPRSLSECIIRTNEEAIEISGLDGAVRADTGGGRIKIDRIGGNVACTTAGGEIVLGDVGGAVHCTTGGGPITAGAIRGEAILETGAGDIHVREVGGLARITTGAGGIHVARAGAAVIASTMGGPIQVEQARGIVTVKNSGGPVQVGTAAGVRCESAGGRIQLTNVSGSLRASTVAGSIVARLVAGEPLQDSFLATSGGDIVVTIPSNLAVTIHAQNELSDIRRIVSEFPGIKVRREGGRVLAEGAVNGGGPVLQISGMGGTIFIRRQP